MGVGESSGEWRTEIAVLKSVPFIPRSSSMPWTRALAKALRSR